MSKRLDIIASLVSDGVGVIDVGTDHGYVPIELCKKGYRGFITATDINEGPLRKARSNLERYGFEDRVKLILCDGFADVDPDTADTVIIAGMGGDTATGILDRAEWCMREATKLILQPVTKPEILRYWLINNEFHIDKDILVKENGTLYQIISASFAPPQKYCDAELFTGKYEYIKDSEYFAEHITRHKKRFLSAANGIDDNDRDGLQAWKKLLYAMADELAKMENTKYEGREHL